MQVSRKALHLFLTFQMSRPRPENSGRPDQTLDGAAQAALAAAARAHRARLLQRRQAAADQAAVQERMRSGADRATAERDIEQVGRSTVIPRN